MTGSEFRQLQQLARFHGIQPAYRDISGRQRQAAPETLQALLRILGVPAENSSHLQKQIAELQKQRLAWCIEPVVIAWDRTPPTVPLHLVKRTAGNEIMCRIVFEDGGSEQWWVRLDQLRSSRPSKSEHQIAPLELPLRTPLPWGYHRLEIETAKELYHSMIISAPTRSYSEPGTQGLWGVFAPLYALHSKRSWGAGDFGDWQQLIEWTASCGGSIVGGLPLMASFLDTPFEPSPYSPASRLFWNEFYLCLDNILEFRDCPEVRSLLRSPQFQKSIKGFKRQDLVDYRAQMTLKREALEMTGRYFFSQRPERQQRFWNFVNEHPRLEDYARFRAATEHRSAPWQSWPDRMRDGSLKKGDYSEKAKRYHLFVQWLAHEQMRAVGEQCYASGVKLYLDLPLGVNPDGYDIWREKEIFALGTSAGAPPDMFFTKGQDWGFPPLVPQKLRERQYEYLIEFLRFQMGAAGALRIDHVMGLHRLYWVPKGFDASQGAYVSYPAEELYAILCLESHRHKTMLVGENLGTVPPEVNSAMDRHHLRRMYVVQYEQRADPKEALPKPPPQSAASLNTHDMPTFAAHWRSLDIADRRDLGLLKPHEVREERRRRREMNEALIAFLKRKRWLQGKTVSTAAVLGACLNYLAAGDAEIVLVTLEDLWQELLPQNVPATTYERPNWRRKVRFSLEEIQRSRRVRDILEMVDALRKGKSGE